jgi:hypothetical protein
MDENSALLARLQQIAHGPPSCEERIAQALAQLQDYILRLHALFDIGASNRLARSTKFFADRALADLRRKILTAEVHTNDMAAPVFTAVRYRIDMARRVLALRLVEEDTSPRPVRHASRSRPSETPTRHGALPYFCFARFGNRSGQLTI